MQIIDISSKGEYPANALSNFYAHCFTLDGVSCASMEGFLQSLKYRSPRRQKEICALTGKTAKKAGGKKFLWKLTGTIHWQGKKFKRISKDFDGLILRAYEALFDNADFREALKSTMGNKLAHTMGGHDKRKTILTEEEFIFYLETLRSRLID